MPVITSIQKSTASQLLMALRDYLSDEQALPVVRCPYCGRWLMSGWAFGETKCGKCRQIVKLTGPMS